MSTADRPALDEAVRRDPTPPVPILELRRVSKRFGEFLAVDDFSLEIASGEFLTLLGASGSGKTTTLRMIAGFEQPTAGEIHMAGRPIAGLPPFKRDVNTVFQHYALFPHMSVRENIGYGLRMRGVPQAEREQRIAAALEMVKLEQLGGRAPRQLSGGQQQRVALARALVNRPKVLLLDEPLGALDLKLRKEMQLELKHLQTHLGITFIYVTHDQEEALTMSDRVALMRQGRIAQVGSPEELYDRPASRYVAHFIGETNLLPGTVVESGAGMAALRVGDVVLLGATDANLPPGARPGSRCAPKPSASPRTAGAPGTERRLRDRGGCGLRRLRCPGTRRHWPAGSGWWRNVPPAPRSRRAHRRTSPGWSSVDAVSATDRSRPLVARGRPFGPAVAPHRSRRCASSRVRHRAALHSLRAAARPLVLAAPGRCDHSRADAGELPAALRHRALSRTILFSAGIALRVTLFSLILAYPLAYLLAFKVKRHKQLMYMAVIIPLWVSYLVRAYAWKIILGQSGILNGLLQAAGLIHEPLTFLLYSRWAVILALTHIYTPFTLMPIYAVLEAIPPALKEASQDLYANRWQTFRRIVLPLSLPGRGCGLHLRLRAQYGRLPRAPTARWER